MIIERKIVCLSCQHVSFNAMLCFDMRCLLIFALVLAAGCHERVIAGSFDWESAPDIYPGVRHTSVVTNLPRRLSMQAVRIDLHVAGIGFEVTGRAEGWQTNQKETSRETTRAFIERLRTDGKPVILAINANYYSPTGNEPGQATLRGMAVSNGILVSPSERNRRAFLITNDGVPQIINTGPDTDIENIRHAVGGYVRLVDSGRLKGENNPSDIGPRTAIGHCRESRYVIMLVIDGRRPLHSIGTTMRETAELLRYFGAWEAINLDGGGSSTMILINPESGESELLNIPSDQRTIMSIPAGGVIERWVGCNIGVYINE